MSRTEHPRRTAYDFDAEADDFLVSMLRRRVGELLATLRPGKSETSRSSVPDAEASRSERLSMGIIDPLLMLYNFAVDSVYMLLREDSHEPPVDLVDLFCRQGVSAHWLAAHAAKAPARPDSSVLGEWGQTRAEVRD